MRSLVLFTALSVLVGLFSSCGRTSKSMKISSFNVRYENPGDGVNTWENRKSLINEFFSKKDADIIGFQEVLHHQLQDLSQMLPEYDYVGVGREDGKEKGEFAPIFFKKEKFELLAKSHFWLSETPEVVGSKSWGAQLARIATWVKLKNKKSGHIFFIFNTHLSHVSEFARSESAVLLLKKIKSLAANVPVLVTGDFNSVPDDLSYKTMTGNWHELDPFSDSYKISRNLPINSDVTFTGFDNSKNNLRIDYIFVNGYLRVLNHETFPVIKDDIYISDHWPVISEVEFTSQKITRHDQKENVPRIAQKPIVNTNRITFSSELALELKSPTPKADIHYTIDGTKPDSLSLKYEAPLKLRKTTILKTFSTGKNLIESNIVERTFIKRKNVANRIKSITPAPHKKYSSPSYKCITDGIIGSTNISDGSWLGFNGEDIQVIMDLKKTRSISEVYASFLTDQSMWIFSPAKISIDVSNDLKKWTSFGHMEFPNALKPQTHRKTDIARITGNSKGRYVKISIKNAGPLPKWHSSEGEASWVFIDEVVVQ
ncbi:hypothetical protein DMA11_02270 [Marinilabiliaceae bacterium JC017]|nr:hypothetical protein DMA11_02270 [Marinilabiliaceae bacterium JC017]